MGLAWWCSGAKEVPAQGFTAADAMEFSQLTLMFHKTSRACLIFLREALSLRRLRIAQRIRDGLHFALRVTLPAFMKHWD
jgi:hypothetical protein